MQEPETTFDVQALHDKVVLASIDSNCKHCHGRGIEGIVTDIKGNFLGRRACRCVTKNLKKWHRRIKAGTLTEKERSFLKGETR